MNCTSLTMAGLLAALSLGMPSLADSIAPGILLPKKNTKSISFSPRGPRTFSCSASCRREVPSRKGNP